MLEQLVECENRLLEEQRRFNELLLAWRSGDLGDDLTRMKIEQMQREVDALGRQLTALRTVIAAQADRERAGYGQRTVPQPAYGWGQRYSRGIRQCRRQRRREIRYRRRRAQCHSPRGSRETRSRRISRHRRGRWQRRRDTSRHPGSRIWKKRSAGRFCRSALQD